MFVNFEEGINDIALSGIGLSPEQQEEKDPEQEDDGNRLYDAG